MAKAAPAGERLTVLTRRPRQPKLPGGQAGASERRRYFSGNSVEIVTRNAFAIRSMFTRDTLLSPRCGGVVCGVGRLRWNQHESGCSPRADTLKRDPPRRHASDH